MRRTIKTALWITLVVALATGAVIFAAADMRVSDAAKMGDVAKVKTLLTQKADVNGAQGDGMTALHWAAFRDDVELMQILLKAGANVKATTRIGAITPLALAAKNGNPEMIEALLAAGADANDKTVTGATVLMAAALSGNADAIRSLVKHGADVNAREKANGQTALMFAAWENRPEAIKALIAAGADINMATKVLELNEPLLDDDGNPIPPRGGRGAREPGANSFMGGMTALLFASRDGKMDAVKALVEAGADVNKVAGGEKSSPIIIAIANGHYTVGKYLLDHGANPNLVNIDGLGPLYATVNMRYAPVAWAPNPITDQETVDSITLINALLDKGANTEARIKRNLWFSPTSHATGWVDNAGSTPFWRAAQSSDVEAMKVLAARGADVKVVSTGGDTPLHVAAGIGWIGNFNQNAPDSWMSSVKLLVELGNDLNAIDGKGYTALHGAASRGDLEMSKYLIEKGAKADIIAKDKNSIADMAFGPSRFFLPKPDVADALQKLGSPFQNNCRSDQCVDGKFLGGATGKKQNQQQ
jgi:ankyrin repeat protein